MLGWRLRFEVRHTCRFDIKHKLGSPSGLMDSRPYRAHIEILEAVLNNRGELLYAIFDLLLTDAAVTKDQAPSLRGSLIAS